MLGSQSEVSQTRILCIKINSEEQVEEEQQEKKAAEVAEEQAQTEQEWEYEIEELSEMSYRDQYYSSVHPAQVGKPTKELKIDMLLYMYAPGKAGNREHQGTGAYTGCLGRAK